MDAAMPNDADLRRRRAELRHPRCTVHLKLRALYITSNTPKCATPVEVNFIDTASCSYVDTMYHRSWSCFLYGTHANSSPMERRCTSTSALSYHVLLPE